MATGRTQEIVTVRGGVNAAMKQGSTAVNPSSTMSGINGAMLQSGTKRSKKQSKSINTAMNQGGGK